MSLTIDGNPIYCWYCGQEITNSNYWESEYDGELYPIHDHCFRDYAVENIDTLKRMTKKLSIFLEQGKLGDLEDFAGQCHIAAAVIMDFCEKKEEV